MMPTDQSTHEKNAVPKSLEAIPMSLPDLASALWQEREVMERLVYRMECEQLILASGKTQWLTRATNDVETSLQELNVMAMRRATLADRASSELGLGPEATLEELAAAAPPPWTGVLMEHRDAMGELAVQLRTVAEANRTLLEVGARAVEQALATVGQSADIGGYSKSGRSDNLLGAVRSQFDQDL